MKIRKLMYDSLIKKYESEIAEAEIESSTRILVRHIFQHDDNL